MKVFVVDDERLIRLSLAEDLRECNYEVWEFSSALSALASFREFEPEVVITDISMPKMTGLELLKKVKEVRPETTVILMTAYSNVSTAIDAVKYGAYDYIEKPFDNQKLIINIQHIDELVKTKEKLKVLKKELNKEFDFDKFVGQGKEKERIFSLVEKVRNSNTSILIVGETGTGKELLTNIIHFNSSRGNGPLVKVSCAILSKELFESELFGHIKGAFTGAETDKTGRFELAHGGTLYLDDIDDMPLDLQVKLLRALEEREIEKVGSTKPIPIDIRVIASTKKDLKQMVDEGKFREDLYYRLSVFPINIPSLRQRTDDIEILLKHFLSIFSEDKSIDIDDQALQIIKNHDFPGNVRELRNLAERLWLISDKSKIVLDDIPVELFEQDPKKLMVNCSEKNLHELLYEVERNAIELALKKSNGNKAKAAEKLGLPPSTLKSKISKFNIEFDDK